MRPLTQILKKASGGQRREEYQSDAAFTPGILAFTRVITADITGVQVGSGPPATEVGQILDADIYFDPASSMTTFATPAALPSNPAAYDLESLIIHELGHTLGFSHSAVWNAMMYPFAPATGTFTGAWPTAQQLDAPLGDDDRAGLRVLYPDANDTVVGAALGGWSCTAQGPAKFDGSYGISHLPVGRSYQVYAEPLDNTVSPALVSPATASLCRNPTIDAGWPPLQSCVVPLVNTGFTTRTRSRP